MAEGRAYSCNSHLAGATLRPLTSVPWLVKPELFFPKNCCPHPKSSSALPLALCVERHASAGASNLFMLLYLVGRVALPPASSLGCLLSPYDCSSLRDYWLLARGNIAMPRINGTWFKAAWLSFFQGVRLLRSTPLNNTLHRCPSGGLPVSHLFGMRRTI